MWRFRSVVGRIMVGKRRDCESRRHSTGSQALGEKNAEFMFQSVAYSKSDAQVQSGLDLQTYSEPFAEQWRPNRHEIALIRRTFPRDEMLKDQIGTEVFSHIFERSPEVLKLFPSFGRYGVKLGLRSDEFLNHMRRFMDVLDFVVDNLHQPREVNTYLKELGVRHRKFAVNKNFRPYHWRVFGEAIAHSVVTILSNPLPVQGRGTDFTGLTLQQTQQIGFVWGRLGDWIMCGTRDGFRDDGLKTFMNLDDDTIIPQIIIEPSNDQLLAHEAKAAQWFEKSRKRNSSKKSKKF